MLPRIVALGLNAEFQRLDGHPVAAVQPEDGPAPRAAAIASFARSFHADEADGLAELDRRIAHQLGRATLEPGANPLRPAVFLHAVGLCWRTVAGGARDEIDVMSASGALWLPALRRTVSTLVAGLPPAPGREDAHGAAAAGPRRAAPEDARRGGTTPSSAGRPRCTRPPTCRPGRRRAAGRRRDAGAGAIALAGRPPAGRPRRRAARPDSRAGLSRAAQRRAGRRPSHTIAATTIAAPAACGAARSAARGSPSPAPSTRSARRSAPARS